MNEQKTNIREIFLNNFVFELIKNSKIEKNNNYQETQAQSAIIKPEKIAQEPIQKPLLKQQISRPVTIHPRIMMPQIPKQAVQRPISQVSAPLPSLTKIGSLIKDPTITEIECTGEGESLLVRRGGAIQKTQVSLSNEEIKNILTEFSAKTKIPIIEGTFKAAINNLIMIAVISEILGPRFIIQKRNPFQPLVT